MPTVKRSRKKKKGRQDLKKTFLFFLAPLLILHWHDALYFTRKRYFGPGRCSRCCRCGGLNTVGFSAVEDRPPPSTYFPFLLLLLLFFLFKIGVGLCDCSWTLQQVMAAFKAQLKVIRTLFSVEKKTTSYVRHSCFLMLASCLLTLQSNLFYKQLGVALYPLFNYLVRTALMLEAVRVEMEMNIS